MFSVISCSYNPESNSKKLAKYAYEHLRNLGHSVTFIDLQDYELPQANGGGNSAYDHPDVKKIHDLLLPTKAIVFAVPIYNYSVGSSAKNLIELLGLPHKDILTGKVLKGKAIALLAAAGTHRSFMAPMGFLNSLMLDFGCYITPQHLIAERTEFSNNQVSEDNQKRIEGILSGLVKLTQIVD